MLSQIKKKIIRNWVFKIGYEKALEALHKEHDEVFLNLGKNSQYIEKKMDRLSEITESIYYVKLLQKINAHQLTIF